MEWKILFSSVDVVVPKVNTQQKFKFNWGDDVLVERNNDVFAWILLSAFVSFFLFFDEIIEGNRACGVRTHERERAYRICTKVSYPNFILVVVERRDVLMVDTASAGCLARVWTRTGKNTIESIYLINQTNVKEHKWHKWVLFSPYTWEISKMSQNLVLKYSKMVLWKNLVLCRLLKPPF